MTRDEAIAKLDCSLAEMARLLGVTTAAVAKWDKEQIPKLREYEINALVEKREKSIIHMRTLEKSGSAENIQN
ncbi:MAG: hypothetical protein DI627_14255 [Acinetobacter sp.]|uniref:Cro/CI family transcriptional regulator n=1 Tax=unclassified Acinetobacter TaxID=196816 RepID=UPI000DB750FF|nr:MULTISPECIES: Cro/CI family transcriptional regulator [unclassified Acinetobacter]PZT84889.1 MAG: hypothetical protein DI627_14255 [Acinetobacter sp.]